MNTRSIPSGPFVSPYAIADDGTRVEHIPHNPDLVRVVEHQPRLLGKRFNFVTPFAGKGFAISNYLRGISTLPLGEAHAVIYDNANDPAFSKRLRRDVIVRFDSFTLIEDKNPQYTVENTKEYWRICNRCAAIYRECLERRTAENLSLTMVVEDDVEIPADAWPKLNRILQEHESVGTAVGSCASRRMKDDTSGMPIAFNFFRTEEYGGGETVTTVDKRIVKAKPLGVEIIGGAHMGCWLSRTELVKEIGIRTGTDGIGGHDLCWGYELRRAGYRTAIDWSVKTKHYYRDASGKKAFV